MQQLGLKHFRMSISWSRLLPGARRGSAVNPEAVRFYNSLLDSLLAAGAAHARALTGSSQQQPQHFHACVRLLLQASSRWWCCTIGTCPRRCKTRTR